MRGRGLRVAGQADEIGGQRCEIRLEPRRRVAFAVHADQHDARRLERAVPGLVQELEASERGRADVRAVREAEEDERGLALEAREAARLAGLVGEREVGDQPRAPGFTYTRSSAGRAARSPAAAIAEASAKTAASGALIRIEPLDGQDDEAGPGRRLPQQAGDAGARRCRSTPPSRRNAGSSPARS